MRASSDWHLVFDQRTLIVLKDTTLSDPVGLETDDALTRITFSVNAVPCHIQFHSSPPLGVERKR
jgi:hypothetical protein